MLSVGIIALPRSFWVLCLGTPSIDNNHHLKLIMEVKGPIPKKMLSKCAFKADHFDDRDRFLQHDIDKVTGKEIVKEVTEEKQMVLQLADLINACLEINPAKRITPEQALKHPLFTTKIL
eukprot:TRINITY_DN4976_c0_g1_i3.p1 TRINITY_DN4976_c0_g1~~TRINITY_DN4976_c0_g1_i3.p1  ORF type:complete len:120 (+),score=5.16 TRINITY_DN4976_c0_g1_i3:60-419(+)